ncbi:IclR family transcriptional regulator [Telmatospirillum sp.]|uniref:IclR family transcriptional regulator n=1 Tax=Telmatospirillum sp. TaxID=2079197 RepID=UPI00284A5F94|nr:IclR family transcriptional regulator [Telmatospirillum sp.]MDR3440987.1 IclR family transcriptional regulator [Telmatospirillum sp.]
MSETEDAAREPRQSSNQKNLIMSLGKGLRVLEAFTADCPEQTQTDIARRTELDNATVFRILNTLVDLGYVRKVENSRHYRLTMKPLDLGFNAIARMDLRSLAQPELRELVGSVREAASLGILDGMDVVFIDRVQVPGIQLTVDIHIGSRIPASCTAIGQAILAFRPEHEIRHVLAEYDRTKNNQPATMTLEQIRQRLADVHSCGYALADSSFIAGLRVLAAPILGPDGFATASLSVAAPAIRMPLPEFMAITVDPLLQATARINKGLLAARRIVSRRTP